MNNFISSTINIPLEPIEKSVVKRNINFLSQKNTITSLASDYSRIIKQSYKGGATVIMDKDFFQYQVEKLSCNNEYHKFIYE